jgi:hypothetical protein
LHEHLARDRANPYVTGTETVDDCQQLAERREMLHRLDRRGMKRH